MERELMVPPFYADDRHMRVFHVGCKGLLGVASYGPGHGVGWATFDPNRRRLNGRAVEWHAYRAADVLVPSVEFEGEFTMPDVVPACCPRCGLGEVSTVDVLAAARKGWTRLQLEMVLTPEKRWISSPKKVAS